MMKRTRWIVGLAKAAVSAAVFSGFAGAANANATIDLIWADTGTNQISSVPVSSVITLQVILTAGANGASLADVHVDYSAAIGTLAVVNFSNTARSPLATTLGDPTDTGSRIEHINGSSITIVSRQARVTSWEPSRSIGVRRAAE